MGYVAQKGLSQPQTLTSVRANRLGLIAPVASRAKVTIHKGFALARLLGYGRLAMADPDAVPAGLYGKAALRYLSIWDSVAPKVASAENVRAALALVERGADTVGIVYETHATASRAGTEAGGFPGA